MYKDQSNALANIRQCLIGPWIKLEICNHICCHILSKLVCCHLLHGIWLDNMGLEKLGFETKQRFFAVIKRRTAFEWG